MATAAAKLDGDFRADAIVASEKALRLMSVTAGKSPLDAGISYCIPSEGDSSALIRKLKVRVVASPIIGIGLWISAAVLGAMAHKLEGADDAVKAGAAFICMLTGSFIFLVPTFLEQKTAKKYLRQSVGDLWANPVPPPIFVSVEYAHTYNKLKVLAEDIGAVLCHADLGCVQIEGLCCRYLIYGGDVTHLSLHANRKTVLLSYRVGDVQLDLAIIPRSVSSELQRQTMGASTGLFEQIRYALTAPPPLPPSLPK